jgi:hypothetical protein
MYDIGHSLDKINQNLVSLNETVLSLKTSNTELQTDFDKLREELSGEIQSTKESFETKVDELKDEILLDHALKSEDITTQLAEREKRVDSEIAGINSKVDRHITLTEGFQGTLHDHTHRISDLEAQIARQNVTIEEMKEVMDRQACATNLRIIRIQQGVDEARLIANDVEAHGRRWAVRIAGLDKPVSLPENPDEAKALVVQFIAEKLGINCIAVEDLDCAHRIGAVKSGKQAIMCRFFRRDLADMVLKVKKNLKGSGCVLFEDATRLNKQLVLDLKARPEVESSWTMGGKVWAKLKGSGKKIKVSINDNLDYRLRNVIIPPQETVEPNPDQTTDQADQATGMTTQIPPQATAQPTPATAEPQQG